MKAKVVLPLSKIGERDVQIAARYAGLDELGGNYLDLIEAKRITRTQRAKLVRKLREFGYTSCDVSEPNNIRPIREPQ